VLEFRDPDLRPGRLSEFGDGADVVEVGVGQQDPGEGDVEVLVFPNTFSELAPQLKPNTVVFVEGRVAIREDRPRLIAHQIIPMDQGPSKLTQAMELVLHSRGVEKELLEQLKGLLARFPGTIPIYLRLETPEEPSMRLKLAEGFRVEPRQDLLDELSQLLGEGSVVIKRQPANPAPSFQSHMGAGGRPAFAGKGAD